MLPTISFPRFTHIPRITGAQALDAAATGDYAENPGDGPAELVLDPRPARRNSLRRLNLAHLEPKRGWKIKVETFEACRLVFRASGAEAATDGSIVSSGSEDVLLRSVYTLHPLQHLVGKCEFSLFNT